MYHGFQTSSGSGAYDSFYDEDEAWDTGQHDFHEHQSPEMPTGDDWNSSWNDQEDNEDTAYLAGTFASEELPRGAIMTSKIPPTFDGKMSFFAFYLIKAFIYPIHSRIYLGNILV